MGWGGCGCVVSGFFDAWGVVCWGAHFGGVVLVSVLGGGLGFGFWLVGLGFGVVGVVWWCLVVGWVGWGGLVLAGSLLGAVYPQVDASDCKEKVGVCGFVVPRFWDKKRIKEERTKEEN